MWQNPVLSLFTWRFAPKRVLMPVPRYRKQEVLLLKELLEAGSATSSSRSGSERARLVAPRPEPRALRRPVTAHISDESASLLRCACEPVGWEACHAPTDRCPSSSPWPSRRSPPPTASAPCARRPGPPSPPARRPPRPPRSGRPRRPRRPQRPRRTPWTRRASGGSSPTREPAAGNDTGRQSELLEERLSRLPAQQIVAFERDPHERSTSGPTPGTSGARRTSSRTAARTTASATSAPT